MRDFKEKNHCLIMLQPSKEVLRSIQSLSKETIEVVNTDTELVTALKELNTTKAIKKIGTEIIDMSNGTTTSDMRNELTSTKLWNQLRIYRTKISTRYQELDVQKNI